ncbi:MAG: PEP-CTERM sorting domain-containing protein [Planctomycetales bacterium]|nr:PEP-CTERM sorting domain-containing protein [Planctomycetales bacterium]
MSPLQLGVFDGDGGARNGHNITGFVPTNIVGRHVDAQAQVRDTLFDDVIANRVPLVVSVEGDQMLGSNVALAAERTGGAVQSFATSAQIVDHGHNGGVLRDIDSVDLWGIEGMTGTNFLSIDGDVAGTSIYSMNIIGPGGVQPYLSQLDIATAIGMPQLDTIIDVDALMVRDLGLDDGTASPFDGQFGPGDAVMFSVAPVSLGGQQVLDGGEIWVWEHGQPAHFLNHGGHVWNTAFSVREVYGTQLENIDALEAVSVPEPSSALLTLLLGGTLAIVRQRRRLT